MEGLRLRSLIYFVQRMWLVVAIYVAGGFDSWIPVYIRLSATTGSLSASSTAALLYERTEFCSLAMESVSR